jgi:hypothetical protein
MSPPKIQPQQNQTGAEGNEIETLNHRVPNGRDKSHRKQLHDDALHQ